MNTLNELIEQNSIKWLPWIGSNYSNNSTRLLIVGESHYYDPVENGSHEKHQSKMFTREVIEEMAVGKDYYQTRIFQNLHLALLGHDDFDGEKIWSEVAFYNFVQRPMRSNKERPSYDDFLSGWNSFHQLITHIKPTCVLFIGLSAANSFNHFASSADVIHSEVQWLEKIGSAYARSCLIYCDGKKLPVYFIRHTSMYFSWRKWNKFLEKTIPHEIGHLKAMLEN